MVVDCDTCRETVSARLDDEPGSVSEADTDAHLACCPSCRAWQDGAAALTRSLRLRPATVVPDLTTAVLDATPTATPQPATSGWLARVVLAGIAVAQLTLGLAQVFGPVRSDHAGHDVPGSSHLFNESTAWNLALGLGLLWTSLRPGATTGTLPVVAGFVAVLVPFSVQDLVAGTATVTRVATHTIMVLGLVLLVIVHRGHRTPHDGRPASHLPAPGRDDSSGQESEPRRDGTRRRPGWRPHLRPVNRHHAA